MVREDDLRGVFNALDAGEARTLGFSAADIVAKGDKIRKRRRALAVAGSGLASAAAILLVVLLPHPAQDPPVGPADPTGVTTTPQQGAHTTPQLSPGAPKIGTTVTTTTTTPNSPAGNTPYGNTPVTTTTTD